MNNSNRILETKLAASDSPKTYLSGKILLEYKYIMYAIIGPMRSGTTLLYRAIKDLSSDYDSNLGDEFFQTYLSNFYVYDNGDSLYQNKGSFSNKEKEIERRLFLLEKYNYRYTIKCLPQHLYQSVLDMIIQKYDVIICERKNEWERFISFVLACTTFNFNRIKKTKIDTPSVRVEKQTVYDFFYLENLWKEKKEILKTRKKNYSHIFYEDFIENPKKIIESRTALKWKKNTKFFRPIYKLYGDNIKKESLIVNLDEVTEWYRLQKNHEVQG